MRTAAAPALLVALLLVGCAAPPPPAGPTEAEIREQLANRQADYWETIAPGESMPVIEPVRYVADYTEQWAEVRGCVADLELDGLETDPAQDHWIITSEDPEFLRTFDRAQWECTAKYPVDPASPDQAFALTQAQAAWLWAYYTSRLIPCFEAGGFTVSQIPTRDEYLAGQWWSPYFALSQSPIDPRDFAMLDAACPPPPIPVQRPF